MHYSTAVNSNNSCMHNSASCK